ncbi:hypothetical protein R0J91_16095, partial [Micrococcus sp. SIMBA_131]
HEKYTWECENGHIFEATFSSVKYSNYWCSECRGVKKYTIEDMEELARLKGGKCLSYIYVNNATPLKWECENGHQWDTTPTVIIRGGWCKRC